MEASTTTTAPPPAKFSRYRTVRARAATLQTLSSHSDNDPPPPPLPKASTFTPAGTDGSVKRAPSRYRRNNNATTPVTSPPLPSGPFTNVEDAHATPVVSDSVKRPTRSPSRYHRTPRPPVVDQHETVHAERHARQGRNHSQPRQPLELAPEQRYDAAREQARLILEGEHDRQRKMKVQAERDRHQAGLGIGSAAPDMRRHRRSQEEQARSPVTKQEPTLHSSVMQPNTATAHEASASPVTTKHGFSKLIPIKSPRILPPPSPPHDPLPTTIEQPTFDAPLSSINTSDRRIIIHYEAAIISLPVTPTTTTKDLLNSASIVLSNPPDPRTSTLLESFTTPQLTLTRPLRRYERVRDILNSWDYDTQNHLVIQPGPPTTPGLDLSDVPPTPPRDITLQMHHTSRPRDWSKRWIRLREDGQVTLSKSPSGTDATNICHLSDFDLYNPSASLIKTLKPPPTSKKSSSSSSPTVFAVKSQQKSSIFLEANGANFAHFFAASNQQVADEWHAAVHGWRSWYLVNVLGEGRVPQGGTGEVLGERSAELVMSPSHQQMRPGTAKSQESTGGGGLYQLGSFRPLVDFGEWGMGNGSGSEGGEVVRGSASLDQRRSVDGRGAVTGGSPKRSATRAGAPPSAFSGLLGQQQQQQQSNVGGGIQEMVTFEDANAGFTGKGLLARSATQRSQGGRGTGRGVQGVRGQPLVDLTPSSEFADGSLLRKLEAWKLQNGTDATRLDREKRVEGLVRSGEGY